MQQMSLISSLTALDEARQQFEQLQEKVAAERRALLEGLHTECGFHSREELIEALQLLDRAPASTVRRKPEPDRSRGLAKGKGKGKGKGRTSPAKGRRLTDEQKAGIIADSKKGLSIRQLAAKYECSQPTICTVRKAGGVARPPRGARK